MNIVPPEPQGFSRPRLARIRTVMQRYVDERKAAGILSLVARRGEVVHFEQVGMAAIEPAQPVAPDTIFRIYSMTKPITSTAALMLYEEGRFRLNDPVANYIPAFKNMKVLDNQPGSGVKYVDATRPITIHDLMTHTSGLSYGFDDHIYIDELVRKHIWASPGCQTQDDPRRICHRAGQAAAGAPTRHTFPATAWRPMCLATWYRWSPGCPSRISSSSASSTRWAWSIAAFTSRKRRWGASAAVYGSDQPEI